MEMCVSGDGEAFQALNDVKMEKQKVYSGDGGCTVGIRI